jgi:hypothetical protein
MPSASASKGPVARQFSYCGPAACGGAYVGPASLYVRGDPSWTHVEPGVAVLGMDEADALVLGAEFGQDAIFVLTPADRRVVGCVDRRVTATGWCSERFHQPT